MQLPELTAEEHAFFASSRHEASVIQQLVERVRGSMTAALGMPVQVNYQGALLAANREAGSLPELAPSKELVNIWTGIRYGGLARADDPQGSAYFADSLIRVLQRAWAEAVVNVGQDRLWPAAMRLELRIQDQTCTLELFAKPESLMPWAKSELERTK